MKATIYGYIIGVLIWLNLWLRMPEPEFGLFYYQLNQARVGTLTAAAFGCYCLAWIIADALKTFSPESSATKEGGKEL